VGIWATPVAPPGVSEGSEVEIPISHHWPSSGASMGESS
jgi:hypothetical protein